MPIESSLSKSS